MLVWHSGQVQAVRQGWQKSFERWSGALLRVIQKDDRQAVLSEQFEQF